jgi:hypothetical protein
MMPLDDPSDPSAETRRLKKRVERLEAGTADAGGGDDSSHAGGGTNSIVLGVEATSTGTRSVSLGVIADASGYAAVSVGDGSEASADYAVAAGQGATASGARGVAVGKSSQALSFGSVGVGTGAYAPAENAAALGSSTSAEHERSTAVGYGSDTTADDQVMLGSASHTVVVPGTFSNPSARRLKRNIVPAPCLRSVFPTQYEWEYIADEKRRRHVGPIADELVGTDAERFLTFDADGAVAGIDKLGLYGAQIAVLLARIEALEEELRGRNG